MQPTTPTPPGQTALRGLTYHPDDLDYVDADDVGFRCADCREVIEADDLQVCPDAGMQCADCYNESHFSCAHCDEIVHNDHEHAVNVNRAWTRDVESVCEDCYDEHCARCEDCGEAHYTESMTDTSGAYSCGSHHVCERCMENYAYCERCEAYVSWDDYHGDDLCDECFEETGGDDDDDDESSPIKDYSERVTDYCQPMGQPKDKLFFGVELEVECASTYSPGELAWKVLDTIGEDFAICKHDGSLSHGFEIVTTPATVEVQRERWTKLLANRPAGLKSWDTSTCGMHVHVSRKGLTPLLLGKLLVFLAQNRGFVERIAGRSSERWAKIVDKKAKDGARIEEDAEYRTTIDENGIEYITRIIKRKRVAGQASGWDRYEALNLCPSRTVEFRIFKGSLKLQTVLKNVEFCAALIAFCRDAGLSELSDSEFLRWIDRAPKLYPNLAEWLRDKGLIRAPRTKPIHLISGAEAVAAGLRACQSDV